MRKSLLTLGVFVLGILSANAQKMHSMDGAAKRVTPMQIQKVKVALAPELYVTDQPTTTFRVSPSKIVRNNPRKAEVEISADYGIPTASYFWGMGAGWTGYSAVILTTSPLAKVTFPNYATYDKEQEVTFAWQVPTSQNTYDMEQDEKGNGIADESFWGYYQAPELTVTQGEKTASYNYGELGIRTDSDGNPYKGYWYATDSITSLSHASYALGAYGGFQDLDKRYEINSDFDGQKVIGYAEHFDKPVTETYVKSIDLVGWIDNSGNIAEPIGDNELTAEIYTLDEEGKMSAEPYATAIATFENYQLVNEANGQVGITFVFTEEDELFGTVEKPIILPDQEFMLLIKGMDKIDGNFVAPFSPANGESGHSYVILEDGSFGTIGYRNYPEIPQLNIMLSLNGVLAAAQLRNPEQKIMFPVEGGYAYYDSEDSEGNPAQYNDILIDSNVKSNEKDENEPWQIEEAPEWVTGFALDDEYQEQYWVMQLFMEAEALPEGVEGREGDVVISAYGRPITIHVTQGKVEEECITEINVEREVGKGYGVTTYEPDFTAALAYLGIENPAEATLVGINADGSEEAAPGPGGIDGWCDADGNFVGWQLGGDSRICVKFFPSVPQYEICDMNGADEVGKTYTVKYGLKANDKRAVFVINVTFVEKQEQEIVRSLSENVIKARVEYETTEESYVEKLVELTDDQVNEILADLQLSSLAEAEVYGWNPTTEKFIADFAPYDGWRDANGDFHNWSGDATVPACVKYTDGKTYPCYNINGCEPQEIKCYWAIANTKRAVLVEVTFAYVVPVGINEINADENAGAIFNINGVRMQKAQQKGIYIQNGKKKRVI